MNGTEAFRASLGLPDHIVTAYLGDLTDEELLVRPAEKANHIAWQLGHLIASENQMVEQVCPGSMPPLPDGFAEKYTKDTASIDDPSAFLKKEEYLELYQQQRAATLAALAKLSDEDLDAEAPESYREICPTVAAIFTLQPTHWVMHAGQWAVIRRQLGREPLF